jgi:hypothetical protein
MNYLHKNPPCVEEPLHESKLQLEGKAPRIHNLYILLVGEYSASRLGIFAPEKDPPAYTRVYQKVSGLAAWIENYKWYSSLPLSTVVSLFCESV